MRAFRLPSSTFGESELNYSEGPIAYNPDHHSIYIVGHAHQQAIAEFDVPDIISSTDVSALRMAAEPRQAFSEVLGRVSGGNPQAMDRIGGMVYLPSAAPPELLVNVYEYYDAPGDNTHTTLAVRDANSLAEAAVDGFFSLEGGAHAAGWFSPKPAAWRAALGGEFITGSSSGMPIISRLSVGPTAFVFDPLDVVGNDAVPSPIPTTALLDFSLDNPLHEDLSNDSRDNDLWTHLSRAIFGFIAPGTRTDVTLGHTGGHASGVCYKCIPEGDTEECGGYCSRNVADDLLYYWLWDVDDLVSVVAGETAPHAVRPYEYGELPLDFRSTELGGGSFDAATGLLYLTVQREDDLQGDFQNPPVVAVYRFAAG